MSEEFLMADIKRAKEVHNRAKDAATVLTSLIAIAGIALTWLEARNRTPAAVMTDGQIIPVPARERPFKSPLGVTFTLLRYTLLILLGMALVAAVVNLFMSSDPVWKTAIVMTLIFLAILLAMAK